MRRVPSVAKKSKAIEKFQQCLPSYHAGRLVFSFGVNNTTIENETRVELASLENTRTILRAAKQLYPVLMVSPLPVVDENQLS